MTKIETKVLNLLKVNGPQTASILGNALWGGKDRRWLPQRYARPAGRVLNSLKKQGLVRQRINFKWELA